MNAKTLHPVQSFLAMLVLSFIVLTCIFEVGKGLSMASERFFGRESLDKQHQRAVAANLKTKKV
jgi:hypothetical protein